MSPRERWQAVLGRRAPDRVPMDYWGTPETGENLCRHLGVADLEAALAALHVDRPVALEPVYVGPPVPPDADVFGIRYRDVSYGAGSYREAVTHPLASFGSAEEIDRGFGWPSPDWWDYGTIRDQVRGREHRPIRGGGSEPLLIYKRLRGEEQAFVDLVENPGIVHACLARLFDLAYENTRRILEQAAGHVLFSYVAEDLGGQDGLMYSPAQIREFLLPGMRRMIELVHGAGAFVFHHGDGSIRPILPELIAIGIDVLNPIQWRCRGMDRAELKRDFGASVVLHGGMDNQRTLPFGTCDEVRAEVAENLATLGAGGGYILAPCHNIQPITPVENIVAMYDEGYAPGRL
jgi:uroporphyrinogen decarboxylase